MKQEELFKGINLFELIGYKGKDVLDLVREEQVKPLIEEILAGQKPLRIWEVTALDFEGKRYHEDKYTFASLLRRTRAGYGFEVLRRYYRAGFSYDRASLSARWLNWYEIRLMLNQKAFYCYQKADDTKNSAFSLTRVADSYLCLNRTTEAEKCLKKAGEIFSNLGENHLSHEHYEYLLFKRLSQIFKTIKHH